VSEETDTLVQKYQRMARIPGFRRGKVPANIIRQRFAEELKTEVMELLVPRYLRQEAQKLGLKPVSEPTVTDLHIHVGEPMRFKASFEVLPDIEVSGYQEMRPEPAEVTVTDEEVEEALANVREQNATYTAVEDRALADGDFAQVSFTGAPEGEGDTKPVSVDDVMVEIGGTNTVREFTENLRGARPGEEKTFAVAYPQDFSDQRLAGKTFTYKVSIKGIKQKNLPELNDEFAKQVGEFDTIDTLRQRIRDGITEEKKSAAERTAKDKIVDELVKKHEFSVPESLVQRAVDARLERGLRALAAQGMRAEDLKKMDFARLRAGQRDSALKDVKVSLILDRIAELEKIDATDEEVDREVEALATQARQPLEQVRERFSHDGTLSRIRDRIRSDKTLDYLYRRPA